MLHRLYSQTVPFTSTDTIAAPATATTLRARIPRQRRRLEGMMLTVTFTNAAAMTGAAADSYAGGVKEIRLNINDARGKRNMIQVNGPALLSLIQNEGVQLDRYAIYGYGQALTHAASNYVVNFFIPCAHPQIAEPFKALTSLPLSSDFLADDPELQIDFRSTTAGGEWATTNGPTAIACKLTAILRDAPDTLPYLPSEIVTDRFVATATSQARYDVANSGFLTGLLIQGYSATTYDDTITRVDPVSAGGRLRLDYGQEIFKETYPEALIGLNDMSRACAVIKGAVSIETDKRLFTGEYFFDFLTEAAGQDNFSIYSALNLNPQALGGDRLKLIFNDLASASYLVQITHHKLLASTWNELKQLATMI